MEGLNCLQYGGLARFVLTYQAGDIVMGQLMPAGIYNGSEVLYSKSKQLHFPGLNKSYSQYQNVVYLWHVTLPICHDTLQFIPLLFHGPV